MIARTLGAGALAAALTLAVMPVVLPYLRRGLRLDEPNERSSHTEVTARGGGVAVALAVIASLVGFSAHDRIAWLIVAVVAATATVGLVDDIRPLGAKRRLAAQLLLGVATLSWFLTGDVHPEPVVLAGAVAVIAFASYVNAFNFMDGINGISGIQAAVAGTVFAVLGVHRDLLDLAVLGAAVAGAGLGFLPFNLRRRPLVFLGDVGSYCLGAGLVSAALLAWKHGATPEASLAPLAIYFADTGATILRRLRRGDDIFAAHREHVYQRITPRGAPHAPTALIVGAATAVVGTLGLVSESLGTIGRVSIGCVAAMVVALYLSLPRATALKRAGVGAAR